MMLSAAVTSETTHNCATRLKKTWKELSHGIDHNFTCFRKDCVKKTPFKIMETYFPKIFYLARYKIILKMTSVIVDKTLYQNVEYVLKELQKKFKNRTLRMDDFEIDVSILCTDSFINDAETNDELGTDLELDFEGGEIKMTSSRRNTPPLVVKQLSKGEIEFREQMDMLMSMFEQETKQLDSKLENERRRIQKKYQASIRQEVQLRTNQLHDTINNLKDRVELLEREMDDLTINFKKEKKVLEDIFQQQLEADRTEMKMKLLHMRMSNSSVSLNEEWQRTKI